ncbi:MAG: hypothetical protein SO064_10105 [Prevotella sp.]|nr:hypothetical protein [Prevotella sp.]
MTYNTDNGITSATEKVVIVDIVVSVDIVVAVVIVVIVVIVVVAVVFVVCLKCRSACKAVLSEASVTRDKGPGLGAWGRTVCKTVPCYMRSLIRGTAFQAAVLHRYTEGFALGYDRFA